jgi:hypothetical protein
MEEIDIKVVKTNKTTWTSGGGGGNLLSIEPSTPAVIEPAVIESLTHLKNCANAELSILSSITTWSVIFLRWSMFAFGPAAHAIISEKLHAFICGESLFLRKLILGIPAQASGAFAQFFKWVSDSITAGSMTAGVEGSMDSKLPPPPPEVQVVL